MHSYVVMKKARCGLPIHHYAGAMNVEYDYPTLLLRCLIILSMYDWDFNHLWHHCVLLFFPYHACHVFRRKRSHVSTLKLCSKKEPRRRDARIRRSNNLRTFPSPSLSPSHLASAPWLIEIVTNKLILPPLPR